MDQPIKIKFQQNFDHTFFPTRSTISTVFAGLLLPPNRYRDQPAFPQTD